MGVEGLCLASCYGCSTWLGVCSEKVVLKVIAVVDSVQQDVPQDGTSKVCGSGWMKASD